MLPGSPIVAANNHLRAADEDFVAVAIRVAHAKVDKDGWTLEELLLADHHFRGRFVEQDELVLQCIKMPQIGFWARSTIALEGKVGVA